MAKNTILVIGIVLAVVVIGIGIFFVANLTKNKIHQTPPAGNVNNTTPQTNGTPVLAFLSGSNTDNIQALEDNLKPGDYLLVGTKLNDDSQAQVVLQLAADIKSKVKPGVNVLTIAWYSKIDEIESRTPVLPKGIDYVIYDYEVGPNFSPEFTSDQQTSIGYFDRALKVAHDNGFKLMITPTYGNVQNGAAVSKPWDWSEIAKHTDAMTIQFQGVFKVSNGEAIKQDMENIVNSISQNIPNELVIVQLSITPGGGGIDENLQMADDMYAHGVKNFLIFYGPSQTNDIKDLLSKR